jgi:hypothetical protein
MPIFRLGTKNCLQHCQRLIRTVWSCYIPLKVTFLQFIIMQFLKKCLKPDIHLIVYYVMRSKNEVLCAEAGSLAAELVLLQVTYRTYNVNY